MPSRPFRITVGEGDRDELPRLVEYARRAEALGSSTLLISDHLLDSFALLPALAAVAQSTSR